MILQARSQGARTLAMVVAVLALLVQGLVVQSHWHGPSAAAGHVQAASGRLNLQASGNDHESAADGCILCLEQAMAGHFTLPPVFIFDGEVTATLHLIAATVLSGLLVRQTSHDWQSRGPPSVPS